ncbi:MAG: hypothetical protein JHC87_01835 [Thermoleophilaceae bacterium]|nr:hypothetical protein [Thermoleophilaceae bacterium]
MTLPGVSISSRTKQPADSIAVKTGTAFFVGTTERGNVGSETLVRSMADYEQKCGIRSGFTTMYDAAETFFREGGTRLYIGRVVGPAKVTATGNLYDQAGSTAGDVNLVVTAKSPGAWGNSLRVAVIAGNVASEFKIQTTHATDTTLNETSPSLPNPAAAIVWSANSAYINLALGANTAENPRVQTAISLTTGADDAASIVDASWQTALDGLSKLLGPGQVAAPGRTTSVGHSQLLADAVVKNRVALLDFADSASASSLQSAALTDRADLNARYGSGYAPWAVIPGVAGSTTRIVPWSAVQAGMLARNDAAGVSINQLAAGPFGEPRYVIGLSQVAWTDAERGLLNDAGVNVVRTTPQGIRTYGGRSLVNPLTNSLWVDFANARTYMAIFDQANELLERFVFRQIDGRGFLFSEVQGALIALLRQYYDAGALYGSTPNEAFTVDVGPQVNTPATIANRELHAVVNLRMSEFAEQVVLEIVKTSITEGV